MKRGSIWTALTCLILTSLILASCTTSTTTTTTTSTTTPVATKTTTTTTTTTAQPSTTKPTTTATAQGKWWDKLGTPQYGGELNLRTNKDIVNFDPYFQGNVNNVYTAWLEPIHTDDWAVDPAIFDFKIGYHPTQFMKGELASSWEFTDTSTYVIHLRQGIHWQNLPPANGRELIADDIVAHYQRQGGYSTFVVDPLSDVTQNVDLVSVTATDKYTVTFKTKTPNPEATMENLQRMICTQSIECPDAVKQWGDVNDWHHSIGTGPYILKDFVSGASATLVKNPGYWGFDDRYPQNQLPYIDTIKYLVITDNSTAISAMRTGKLDCIELLSLTDAQAIQKSNPELVQFTNVMSACETLEPRNDLKPYSDIRVRKALQLALDLNSIAKNYFSGTADPYPQSLASSSMTGWAWPYDQWPQSLKDEYAYNPTKAKQLLADAGFPNGFKTDIVADNAGGADLLQIVKSYFLAIGVDMEIRPMDSAAWAAMVVAKRTNDALAFREGAGTLGNINTPLKLLTRDLTGFGGNFSRVSDPVFDAFYTKAMSATTVDQVNSIVIDANKYVAQQHFAISMVQPNTFGFTQPWFKGYIGQFGAETAGSCYLSHYLPRFWIDQNVKKSIGH
jgi:peptide/nickel transport system substrate-binding protein